MLNFGIIGPGKVADTLLAPALKQVSEARLWSVAGRDPVKTGDFARRHGAAAPQAAHTDLAEALRDPELHAVIIATPDHLHAAQAITAAEAGKHLLVEKPLATGVAEGRAMVDAARANGVALAVGYHLRWHAGHRLLAERLRAGALGKLLHARVQWTYRTARSDNWRASGKSSRWWALSAFGTHCLDLIRWFMVPTCGEVVEITAIRGNPQWNSANEETALVALRFKSGATAEFLNSVLFESERKIELIGASGTAFCRGTLGPDGAGQILLLGEELSFAPVNPYVAELEAFARTIREQRLPEPDAAEALRNVDLLERAVGGVGCRLAPA